MSGIAKITMQSQSTAMEINICLMHACQQGNLKAVIMLFLRSTEVNPWFQSSEYPCPAILIACQQGFADIVAIILYFQVKRAKVSLVELTYDTLREECYGRDEHRNSLMFHAIQSNHIHVVAVLLYFDRQCLFEIDSSTYYAIDIANSLGRHRIANFLQLKLAQEKESELYLKDSVIRSGISKSSQIQASWMDVATFRITILSMCFAMVYTLNIIVHRESLLTNRLKTRPIGESFAFRPPQYLFVGLIILSLISQMFAWLLMWIIYYSDPGQILPLDDKMRSVLYCSNQEPSGSGLALGRARNTSNDDTYILAIDTITRSNGSFAAKTFCCHLCHRLRPLRSGHSRWSQRCVPVFDHFCAFLWNDIGRDNYGFFFILVANMGCVAMPSFIVLAVTQVVCWHSQLIQQTETLHLNPWNFRAQQQFQEYLQNMTKAMTLTSEIERQHQQELVYNALANWYLQALCTLFLFVFVIWSILVWFGMLLIFGYHIFLIYRGMTSMEYANLSRATSPEGFFPYLTLSNTSRFARSTFLENLIDRLFPLLRDFDYYSMTDAEAALLASANGNSLREGLLRGIRTLNRELKEVASLWFTKQVNSNICLNVCHPAVSLIGLQRRAEREKL